MTIEDSFDLVINNTVPKHKTAWYEWAATKAYLAEAPRSECIEIYNRLFSTNIEDNKEVPKWLIKLACQSKAYEAGFKRTGKRWEGIEAISLGVVRQLSVKALNDNPKVLLHLHRDNPELLAGHR